MSAKAISLFVGLFASSSIVTLRTCMKRFRYLPIQIILSLAPLIQAAAEERTLTLDQYLSEVRSQSPDLIVEKANVEAAAARASGVRIPPPMVGVMQMKDGEGTNQGYEISQELPFPTKIYQDKKVRQLEYETRESARTYQTNSILADARIAFVEFWNAHERLKVLKEKHHWLKHHVKLTRSATRSSSSEQVHLLEVESDADMLENEVLALESELVEKQAALKTFAPSLELADVVPSEPQIVDQPKDKPSQAPMITWREKELEALQANESLKQQAYVPDVFLRLRSFNGNASTPQSQEVMVGVTVPFLYFWQPRAEVAEASAQRQRAKAELQKARVEFDSRLQAFLKKAEATQAQLKNIKEKLLPRAQRRVQLVKTISQRTMEGLDEHKSVMLGLLDLKIKAADLKLEYENINREILKLTGGKVGAQ